MDACLRLLLVETLHAFPPALIFSGKFDPLRDDPISMLQGWNGQASQCMRYQGALGKHSFCFIQQVLICLGATNLYDYQTQYCHHHCRRSEK